ncbi:putative exocyst complex component Exo70, cullin repeat-like-containing domain superfamily [Helianthus annuus]|nr:putative exocyst complex component Exo70, cullin repeat-like-containing domain superfamily [Helianthus annuus]
MATTVEGQDRVLATAQQIVKSLNINNQATEDMLLILSSFDNRLSNISDLTDHRFETAEQVILRHDSVGLGETSSEYLEAVDTIIKLTENLNIQSDCNGEVIDRAENALQELKAIADRMISFVETTKGCVMQVLNFGEAVAIGQRSSEKLFRILDMYDVVADVLPDFETLFVDESGELVCNEVKAVLSGLGEAAIGTFVEFENAVKGENSRRALQGGEIHPVTRYVMNYLKLLVDYSEILNILLPNSQDYDLNSKEVDDIDSGDTLSPVSCRLLSLITSLEANLEEKSRLYDDNALKYIFLMNNILYIVQKVKDSDLRNLLGDRWIRKHSGQIRQWHTSYLRSAWGKALLCLKDDGIGGGSSSASKLLLKERFKNFNACFEEIYRIQSLWRVPDDQLREELRISISEKVLPAYRAFVGRFGSQLDGGRHSGKYVKYTIDDLENYLSDLFEGKPAVLNNIKRKGT